VCDFFPQKWQEISYIFERYELVVQWCCGVDWPSIHVFFALQSMKSAVTFHHLRPLVVESILCWLCLILRLPFHLPQERFSYRQLLQSNLRRLTSPWCHNFATQDVLEKLIWNDKFWNVLCKWYTLVASFRKVQKPENALFCWRMVLKIIFNFSKKNCQITLCSCWLHFCLKFCSSQQSLLDNNLTK
jgi:hypothetical protein